jgi:hypothetical protein
MKLYKGGSKSMVLYVPRPIVAVIPPDAHFAAELTDEGVLFRFVGLEEPAEEVQPVPDWAKRS